MAFEASLAAQPCEHDDLFCVIGNGSPCVCVCVCLFVCAPLVGKLGASLAARVFLGLKLSSNKPFGIRLQSIGRQPLGEVSRALALVLMAGSGGPLVLGPPHGQEGLCQFVPWQKRKVLCFHSSGCRTKATAWCSRMEFPLQALRLQLRCEAAS